LYSKGEKITAKAHGGTIDIQGMTVAEVDEQLRVTKLETWFDPMSMFRQIAPEGIVNKQIVDPNATTKASAESKPTSDSSHAGVTEKLKPAPEPKVELKGDHADAALVDVKSDADSVKDLAKLIEAANLDSVTQESSKDIYKGSKTNGTTEGVSPFPGQAVAAKPESEEAKATYREMNKLTPLECPFMNVE